MNVFKRYHHHKSIRHGGGGVRTSDAAGFERFQQREAMASRANASRRGFVWKAKWNTAPGKTTSPANINEINKAFWAKKQNEN